MKIINDEGSKKLIGEIVSGLNELGRVKVTGLGFFLIKNLQERQGKNPRTGEVITIPARRKIAFKPSKTLKDMFMQ